MEAIQRRGRNNLTGNITVNVRSNATGMSRAVTAKQDLVLHADSRVRYYVRELSLCDAHHVCRIYVTDTLKLIDLISNCAYITQQDRREYSDTIRSAYVYIVMQMPLFMTMVMVMHNLVLLNDEC